MWKVKTYELLVSRLVSVLTCDVPNPADGLTSISSFFSSHFACQSHLLAM